MPELKVMRCQSWPPILHPESRGGECVRNGLAMISHPMLKTLRSNSQPGLTYFIENAEEGVATVFHGLAPLSLASD